MCIHVDSCDVFVYEYLNVSQASSNPTHGPEEADPSGMRTWSSYFHSPTSHIHAELAVCHELAAFSPVTLPMDSFTSCHLGGGQSPASRPWPDGPLRVLRVSRRLDERCAVVLEKTQDNGIYVTRQTRKDLLIWSLLVQHQQKQRASPRCCRTSQT